MATLPAVELGEVLGWIGTALFLARLVPQPWHTWRSGVADGVSTQALLNGMASDLGWLTYGLAAGLAPVWVASLVAFPITATTLVLLRHRITGREVAVAGTWVACMALAWALGGPLALGTVLGVAVVVNYTPQAVRAVRSDDLSGLHPATFWLSLLDAALWGGYGALAGDVALLAYAAVLGVVAVVVLVRIAQTRGALPPAVDVAEA